MKTKVSKTTNILLRVIIMLLTFGFAYKHLIGRNDWKEWYNLWTMIINQPEKYLLFALVLLLLPVNILIESYKWKFLIDKIEKVKLNKAFTAVLTGISVSMFLPNRVGDYLGRVFVLKYASHIKGILVTIIGSISQMLTTFLAGGMALIFAMPLFYDFSNSVTRPLYFGLIVVILLFNAFLMLMYFNVGLLKVISVNIFKKRKEQIERYAEVFTMYNKLELLRIFSLSILRFGVFSFQFYLMLHIFGIEMKYPEAMKIISLIYLALTVIPTIAITELGVRGSVAVSLFSFFLADSALWTEYTSISVLAASSVVWLINLALPGMAGAIFVFRLNFIREKADGN